MKKVHLFIFLRYQKRGHLDTCTIELYIYLFIL